MKRIIFVSFILALVSLSSIWLAGCTEEKLIEIAIKTEYGHPFDQNSASVSWDNTVTISIADSIRAALDGTQFDESDIEDLIFNGAAYEVTKFSQATDWVIEGEVLVQRLDPTPGPEVQLLEYQDESVPGSLNVKTTAILLPAGVAVIQGALDAYLAGGSPEIKFIVRNGDVVPPPGSPGADERIIFTWMAYIQYQILVSERVEMLEIWP